MIIRELKSKNARLALNVTELEELIKKLEGEIAELKATVEGYKAYIVGLQTDISDRETYIDGLMTDFGKEKVKWSELDKKLKSERNENLALLKKQRDLNEAIENEKILAEISKSKLQKLIQNQKAEGDAENQSDDLTQKPSETQTQNTNSKIQLTVPIPVGTTQQQAQKSPARGFRRQTVASLNLKLKSGTKLDKKPSKTIDTIDPIRKVTAISSVGNLPSKESSPLRSKRNSIPEIGANTLNNLDNGTSTLQNIIEEKFVPQLEDKGTNTHELGYRDIAVQTKNYDDSAYEQVDNLRRQGVSEKEISETLVRILERNRISELSGIRQRDSNAAASSKKKGPRKFDLPTIRLPAFELNAEAEESTDEKTEENNRIYVQDEKPAPKPQYTLASLIQDQKIIQDPKSEEVKNMTHTALNTSRESLRVAAPHTPRGSKTHRYTRSIDDRSSGSNLPEYNQLSARSLAQRNPLSPIRRHSSVKRNLQISPFEQILTTANHLLSNRGGSVPLSMRNLGNAGFSLEASALKLVGNASDINIVGTPSQSTIVKQRKMLLELGDDEEVQADLQTNQLVDQMYAVMKEKAKAVPKIKSIFKPFATASGSKTQRTDAENNNGQLTDDDEEFNVDLNTFREYVYNMKRIHKKCGEDCIHLRRFYTKIGWYGSHSQRPYFTLKKKDIDRLPKIIKKV